MKDDNIIEVRLEETRAVEYDELAIRLKQVMEHSNGSIVQLTALPDGDEYDFHMFHTGEPAPLMLLTIEHIKSTLKTLADEEKVILIKLIRQALEEVE